MSPELETLDQLLGGDLSLKVILGIFPEADAVRIGVMSLVTSGDAFLLMAEGDPVPAWRIRELFVEGTVIGQLASLNLRITAQGIRRIS
jgi:hypothetical protein